MPFSIQNVASDIDAAFLAIALVRLLLNGLRRRYPGFTAFLALSICRSLFLFHASPATHAYVITWAITSSVLWLAQAFACLEICALVFERYGGVDSLADRALSWCFGVSVLIAGGFGILRTSHNPYVPGWFGTISAVGRALTLGCALAMVGQAAMFRLFPATLSRNLTVHRWAFTAYSCVIALSLVLTTDFDARVAVFGNLLMGISTTAIAGIWALSFRKNWELPQVSSAENSDEDRRELTARN